MTLKPMVGEWAHNLRHHQATLARKPTLGYAGILAELPMVGLASTKKILGPDVTLLSTLVIVLVLTVTVLGGCKHIIPRKCNNRQET